MRSVVVSPEWLERTAPALVGSDATVFLGTPELLRSLTGFHVHRGALAAVHRTPLPDVAQVVASATRILVFEAAVNHTNLGAVFRSAAGLGIDGVVLSPDCADPLYRRAVRVSMGAVLTLPYARASRWPESLDELRAAGFTVAALTPGPEALDLAEVRVADDQKWALVVGTEGPGLRPSTLRRCDLMVRIPMSRDVDSLNVGAAAAVAFWALRPPSLTTRAENT